MAGGFTDGSTATRSPWNNPGPAPAYPFIRKKLSGNSVHTFKPTNPAYGKRKVSAGTWSPGKKRCRQEPNDKALIDHILYWIPCRDGDEANYLLAIINSNALQEAVQPFMSKGQFGARDLHKHLWKLPIPEYDPGSQLHVEITQAGASAATGAGAQLAALRKARGNRLTSTIARRELRKWLRESDEGKTVEKAVTKLLAGD